MPGMTSLTRLPDDAGQSREALEGRIDVEVDEIRPARRARRRACGSGHIRRSCSRTGRDLDAPCSSPGYLLHRRQTRSVHRAPGSCSLSCLARRYGLAHDSPRTLLRVRIGSALRGHNFRACTPAVPERLRRGSRAVGTHTESSDGPSGATRVAPRLLRTYVRASKLPLTIRMYAGGRTRGARRGRVRPAPIGEQADVVNGVRRRARRSRKRAVQITRPDVFFLYPG